MNIRMNFYLIGIDYKRAGIDAREDLYRRRREIAGFWQGREDESVLLCTCNRLEIYLESRRVEDSLACFYYEFPQFKNCGYFLSGQKAILRHLLRLACGLESQLKGELEIAQQLELWRKQDFFPLWLNELVEKAIFESREIRRASSLARSKANLATLVLDDIAKRVEHGNVFTLLILGTGKIAELFSLFPSKQARFYFAAHKNFMKAKLLAERAQAEAISLKDIGNILLSLDAVVSATSSPHFLLRAKDIAGLFPRRNKPLYLYDLAIPRDIEPETARLPQVFLKNLEDLAPLFEEYNAGMRENLALAEYLCNEAVKAESEKNICVEKYV